MIIETTLTETKTTDTWDSVSLFFVNRMEFLRFKKVKQPYDIYFCLKLDSIKAVSNSIKKVEISIDPELFGQVMRCEYMKYIFDRELHTLSIYFDIDTCVGKRLSDVFFGIKANLPNLSETIQQ
ncbi:MAG: hypothetical protein F6K17_17770 [Okeania sp. SIO3C4]|nr:hypothetical protein [Okeania sp. SIO3C4]